MLQFHLSPVHAFDFVRLASGEMGGVGVGGGVGLHVLGTNFFYFHNAYRDCEQDTRQLLPRDLWKWDPWLQCLSIAMHKVCTETSV